MTGTTANPARHTQAEMGVQASPSPQPQGGQLEEQVWRLLLSEDPIRIIGEIPVEDREKLIDEVNQVGYSLSLAILFSHCVHIGV